MTGPTRIRLLLFLLFILIVTGPYDDLSARGRSAPDLRRAVATPPAHRAMPAVSVRAPSGADTTEVGFWDFDGMSGCDPQGWVSADATAQAGDFFHVDDFAGLGGGDFGRLHALQGDRSLWCGARPGTSNEALCSYATLPGYGDDWIQNFCMAECDSFSGDATIEFLAAWDTEADYDYVSVQWEKCDEYPWEYWMTLAEYDGVGGGFQSHTVAAETHGGSLRFQIRFESDIAWSDADGIYNTDGAVIVDSLTVRDTLGVVLPTELFETESVGDTETATGNWVNRNLPYGDFAGLFPGTGVVQWREGCAQDPTCLWGFFDGSTFDYACQGFPEQAVVPYQNARDQYIHNYVWSPEIDYPPPGGSQIELQYEWYADNVLDELIFSLWRVRSRVDGCWQPWTGPDQYFLYYGTGGWSTVHDLVSPYIDPAASQFQVALGVRDMCQVWCGIYADTPVCHGNGPLYDNVRLYTLEVTSPVWMLDDRCMFQDTFAGDGTLTGTARADMATDLLLFDNPNVLPGDSVAVTVIDVDNGLAADPYTGDGAAVYCYVSVRPRGQAGKSGDALSGDPSRWPVVDSLAHAGATWYAVRMDTVFEASGEAVENRFCVDLNDNLFTPGDTVCFVFAARSGAPLNTFSYATLGLVGAGAPIYETEDLATALDHADEFTVLPTVGGTLAGDILYVDGVNTRGAQAFFNDVFQALGLTGRVDRYDIRSPESREGNHPGARVTDVAAQLSTRYRFVVWSTGPSRYAFGDGTWGTKSDDASMLREFLGLLDASGGVYLSGDDVADEWDRMSGTGAAALRADYLDFGLDFGGHNHEPVVGVSPFVVGEPGSIFTQVPHGWPDSVVADGGCPTLNDFDLLTAAGACTVQASYHGNGNTRGAVVMQKTPLTGNVTAGFVLSGFGFEQIRDVPPGNGAAAGHMLKILTALGLDSPTPVDRTPVYSNSLAQNYPNPFNPATTIRYQVAKTGPVTLAIYNVAGQRVRTLVDGPARAGEAYEVRWRGLNDAGSPVASGVYFYKLVAGDYTRTRKMVLLK